jgi:hypothetical protein
MKAKNGKAMFGTERTIFSVLASAGWRPAREKARHDESRITIFDFLMML